MNDFFSITIHFTAVKCVGVEDVEPSQYIAKYGSSIMKPNETTPFDHLIKTSDQNEVYQQLAQEQKNASNIELEGDVEALRFLDLATLEREGLSHYRHLLNDRSNNVLSSASC